MDISGISTSANAANLTAYTTAGAVAAVRGGDEAIREARHEQQQVQQDRSGRALGIFRRELHASLAARFQAKHAASQGDYVKLQQPATADEVAAETLGAARQLAAESPASAAQSLISFRARLHQTASYVRETVTADDDIAGIDQAVAQVEDGLTELEGEVANNRESSASVLAVDTQNRQRSTIRIRTQEGDVVRLSLRRTDSVSATDVSVVDGASSASATEVEVSSRSRMMLRVDGDLNESEMAAIQNVFGQAEQIANEFFGGDIGAAFNMAAGFEFDTEQLARVNLRFRMRQTSNVSYAETVTTAPATEAGTPAVTAPQPTQAPASVTASNPVVTPGTVTASNPVATPASTSAPEPVATPVAAPRPQPVSAPEPTTAPVTIARPVFIAPIATEAPLETPATEPRGGNEPGQSGFPDLSSLSSFFDAISAFLRTVGGGFSSESGGGSFSFHYSESFKLEFLSAVFNVVAPDGFEDAAANAELLVESVVDSDDTTAAVAVDVAEDGEQVVAELAVDAGGETDAAVATVAVNEFSAAEDTVAELVVDAGGDRQEIA